MVIAAPEGAFRHGFLAVVGGSAPVAEAGWDAALVGRIELLFHPTLRRTASAWGRHDAVCFLGEVVDLEHPLWGEEEIAHAAALELVRGGIDAVVRFVAYLGGRFVCLVATGARVVVIPDCHATQRVYWQPWQGGLAMASHANLLAELTAPGVDEEVLGLMRRGRHMKTGGTRYLPGVRTPFVGVRPLLPNHVLDVDVPSGVTTHKRFYPSTSQSELDPQLAVERFEELFRGHVQLLCRYGRVGTSLTAGFDSRTSFLAAYSHMLPGSFAWTWNDFEEPKADLVADVLGANELAFQLGVPHRVIALRRPDDLHRFEESYERTFRFWPQHERAAFAVAAQLPADFFQLLSMLAETGTGFYKRRTPGPWDAGRLSQLYSSYPFGRLPEVIDLHEEFIEYAGFTEHAMGGIDYHDLFYWEARAGRWATARIQEADLSHRVLLPFNQRGIIESLHALPLPARVGKQPLAHLIERLRDEHLGASRTTTSPLTSGPLQRWKSARVMSRRVRGWSRRFDRAPPP